MSDLDGLGATESGSNGFGGLDPMYEDLLKRAATVGESERAEQDSGIPAGDYYLEVTKAEGKINTYEGKEIISAAMTLKVLEGRQAVGRVCFVDLPLTPSDKVWDKRAEALRDANPAEYVANQTDFIKLMNRIQRVFGLSSPLPGAKKVDAISGWIKPSVGKKVVMGIRFKEDKNGVGRNKAWWANVAAPEDPVYKDKAKTIRKGTALSVLQEAVAKKKGNGPVKVGGTSLD